MGPGAQDLMRVVADTRLSSDARIVTLHVAGLGDGEHELDYDELRRLLNQAGERRIRRAVQDAVAVGWITWRPGGRGHGAWAQFTTAESAGLNGATAERPTDRAAESAGVKDRATDRPAETAALNEPGKDTTAESAGVNKPEPLTTAESAGLRDSHTRVQAAVVADDDEGIPPVVPHAVQALDQHSDTLAGCRGALRDYLAARVEPEKQYAYVQTVATWLNGSGFVWTDASGSTIPIESRAGMVAAALNELNTDGEQKMVHPTGSTRNLKTKLSIITKPIDRRSHGGANGSRAARGADAKGRGEASSGSAGGGKFDHLVEG